MGFENIVEDEEWDSVNKTYSDFKGDLKALFDKYQIKLVPHDTYNGMDEYVGCEVYLSLFDKCLYRDSVGDLIKEITENK